MTGTGGPTPLVDHHQHLFSPAIATLISTPSQHIDPIVGSDLVVHLDDAGIGRPRSHLET